MTRLRAGAVGVVFAKEVRDNLRDLRSLLSAMLYPLLGPLVFSMLLNTLTAVAATESDPSLPLPIAGAANAPELARFLEAHQFRLHPVTGDPVELVRKGETPVVLVVPEGVQQTVDGGSRAVVTVVDDNSRAEAIVLVSRLQEAVQDYSQTVAKGRLQAQGLDPLIMSPLVMIQKEVARQHNTADTLLTMIPAFMMFTLFIGGVYLAIDSISGERERGSLEPLLCHPVPRWQVLAGKSLAAGVFSLMAVAIQLSAFHVMIGDRSGLFSDGAGLGLPQLLRIVPLLLPMLAMAVSVQMLVAILTRSYKEAQTWLGLLPLLPALPSMALAIALVPGHAPAWLAAVPLVSQTVAMQAILLGHPPSIAWQLLGSATTLLVTALLFALAARRMESEGLVFGTSG